MFTQVLPLKTGQVGIYLLLYLMYLLFKVDVRHQLDLSFIFLRQLSIEMRDIICFILFTLLHLRKLNIFQGLTLVITLIILPLHWRQRQV